MLKFKSANLANDFDKLKHAAKTNATAANNKRKQQHSNDLTRHSSGAMIKPELECERENANKRNQNVKRRTAADRNVARKTRAPDQLGPSVNFAPQIQPQHQLRRPNSNSNRNSNLERNAHQTTGAKTTRTPAPRRGGVGGLRAQEAAGAPLASLGGGPAVLAATTKQQLGSRVKLITGEFWLFVLNSKPAGADRAAALSRTNNWHLPARQMQMQNMQANHFSMIRIEQAEVRLSNLMQMARWAAEPPIKRRPNLHLDRPRAPHLDLSIGFAWRLEMRREWTLQLARRRPTSRSPGARKIEVEGEGGSGRF